MRSQIEKGTLCPKKNNGIIGLIGKVFQLVIKSLKFASILGNSTGPGKMLTFEALHLGLNCFLKYP